ncbi:MAG TPA: hypothetical protein VI759_05650 [Dehalococcoidia bacterium]|nr:hypothetical protein [Dehalococcoidia bacterium]
MLTGRHEAVNQGGVRSAFLACFVFVLVSACGGDDKPPAVATATEVAAATSEATATPMPGGPFLTSLPEPTWSVVDPTSLSRYDPNHPYLLDTQTGKVLSLFAEADAKYDVRTGIQGWTDDGQVIAVVYQFQETTNAAGEQSGSTSRPSLSAGRCRLCASSPPETQTSQGCSCLRGGSSR